MTQKSAIATHLGMDIHDLDDCEYQSTKNSGAKIFVIGNNYYCAIKNKPLPRKNEFNWTEVKDDYVNKNGYKIYITEI